MIIKTDRDMVRSYFEDSSNVKGGWAREVLFPESPEEIGEFLAKASRERIPVTVSGGGTGTTGARVPFGGAVLSLERLDKILDVSVDDSAEGRGVGKAQAGVLVDDFMRAAESKGLFYTCHPTEKTATLGGTVATNASGSRSFRYGPTRRFVRAMKVVLATGEIVCLRRGERALTRRDSRLVLGDGRSVVVPMPSYRMPSVKNSAGYYAKDGMDAIDLFIGQEGTLGVVAEVEIGLVRKPDEILSCFAFFSSEPDSWNFAQEARALNPLSIEYFDRNALAMLRARNPNIPQAAHASIFFEAELRRGAGEETTDAWQALLDSYHVSEDEVWAAETEREARTFIEFRHSIPSIVNETIRSRGFQKLSTDIAVPDKKFSEMMKFYIETLRQTGLEHVIFGHIGESHVHVNILPRSQTELEDAKAAALRLVRKGISLGGTVSAEHGIGKIKHIYLEELYGPQGVREMARVKKALDPACILGLDNIFPRSILNTL